MGLSRNRTYLALALLLVAVVALSAYQCVTACVDEACAPPCHAHSHAKSCMNPSLSAVLTNTPQIAAQAASSSLAPMIESIAKAVAAPAHSIALPDSNSSSTLILRI